VVARSGAVAEVYRVKIKEWVREIDEGFVRPPPMHL